MPLTHYLMSICPGNTSWISSGSYNMSMLLCNRHTYDHKLNIILSQLSLGTAKNELSSCLHILPIQNCTVLSHHACNYPLQDRSCAVKKLSMSGFGQFQNDRIYSERSPAELRQSSKDGGGDSSRSASRCLVQLCFLNLADHTDSA